MDTSHLKPGETRELKISSVSDLESAIHRAMELFSESPIPIDRVSAWWDNGVIKVFVKAMDQIDG